MKGQDIVPSSLEEIGERYERLPALRALVQLFAGVTAIANPIGAAGILAAEASLNAAVVQMRSNRARVYFDELAKRKEPLTEEEIHNFDFLHAFFATAKAAANTQREEKIRLFARLLVNYTKTNMKEQADIFDEHLKILLELDWREIYVLLILDKFEAAKPYFFRFGDITDVYSFVEMISRKEGDLGFYIASRLSSVSSEAVHKAKWQMQNDPFGKEAEKVQKILIHELNIHIMSNKDLYTMPRFPDPILSDETRQMLNTATRPEEKFKLNRLLLEDAFPKMIARNHSDVARLSPREDEDAGTLNYPIYEVFWPDFCQTVVEETGIPKDQIPGFIERLKRTGLYQAFVGIDSDGVRGYLTPNFYSLADAVRSEDKAGGAGSNASEGAGAPKRDLP